MSPTPEATEGLALCLTAATVGVVHTLLGPDHYMPFVAMSRAGDWSLRKTLRVTTHCGLAHVTGSVAIGLIGIVLGMAVMRLETVETFRGDVAAWLMIGFGLVYTTWGLAGTAWPRGRHDRCHTRRGSRVDAHVHPHDPPVRHVGDSQETAATATPVWSPWVLFLVFAFGPCEPLIPLLMVPAAKASWWAVAAVCVAFTVATLLTMAAAVVILNSGASLLPFSGLQRYAHAIAGVAILACGVMITLGL